MFFVPQVVWGEWAEELLVGLHLAGGVWDREGDEVSEKERVWREDEADGREVIFISVPHKTDNPFNNQHRARTQFFKSKTSLKTEITKCPIVLQ